MPILCILPHSRGQVWKIHRLVSCITFLFLTTFLLCEGAYVLDYTVDVGDTNTAGWSAYQSSVCTGDNTLTQASTSDDGRYFDAVGVSSPFFDDDSTPWYASPNGFVAATPYPMCSFFCTDLSVNTLYGSYAMTAARGSDWPILALFTADLDPSHSGGKAHVCAKTDDTGDFTVVEYSGVPRHGEENVADALTAQVVIYTDGTFIFRYKQLPSYFEATPAQMPIAGISASSNRFVASPVPIRAGLALRFSPVMDSCSEAPLAESEASCTSDSTCLWCAATAACMHSSVAPHRCPSGTFTAGTAIAASRYTVKVDYDGEIVVTPSTTYTLSPGLSVSVMLPVFQFPFFPADGSSTNTFREILFTATSTLTMGVRRQGCNPLDAVCVNGNYSNAILAYQSASATKMQLSVTTLDNRPPGSLLCASSEATNCPAAIVLRMDGIVTGGSVSSTTDYRPVNAQLFIDAAGTIDIVIESQVGKRGERLFAYPPPYVGVMRQGLNDPESLVIPNALLRSGLHVRYTVRQPNCPDCGLHGRCDAETSACVCDADFQGASCGECADAAKYGPNCDKTCPPCGHGHCHAGTSGTGVCICPEGMTGPQCTESCPTRRDSTVTPVCSEGGYIECGACVCFDGWHGGACNMTDPDPCRANSLGGCPDCVAQEGCSFCFDYVCFSPSLSGSPRGYACSYASPFPQQGLCVAPAAAVSDDRAYTVTLGVLLGIVTVLIICLFFLALCLTRSRRNVYDIRVVRASGGAPDLGQPRREREVRHVGFVPRTKEVMSAYLTAIPLKQISLKKLYEKQHGLDNNKKGD